MKVTVLENKYCSIYLDLSLDLFEQYWHSESLHMEEEDYKETHLTMRDHLAENAYTPHRFFLDNRLNFFVISPELQEWHAKNISTKVVESLPNPGLLRVAIIVSEDFISQLSIEQTIEEYTSTNEFTKYFQDEVQAREWLLN